MSIMNGQTWLRLEFILCNGLHKLTFDARARVVRNFDNLAAALSTNILMTKGTERRGDVLVNFAN